ncbi:hypothetical protein B1R32_106100 [Abditibacterium utsteinense]|uniref:Uncharacterized protein n=1 Tax=Abditibacterium utsteinense TaxID=1960156 RepID=A0A2S8STX3_9BACT|nr:hypothetical protein [Abditibacterium utsteinense]PQV64254.1 hypothetical protein B1R32_106100 [Abditibacterium utsteinense]
MPVSSPLLPLFGKPRRPLGWQGYTTEVPADWNPGKFSGTRERGDLRVDDENGVRFELRWENAAKTPDVEKSVANFLGTLEKDAKKSKTVFQVVEGTHVVSRSKKRKEQVTSFGWIGEAKGAASCGFGAAWHCPICGRVTFAHIVGQPNEKSAKIERLASEILGPLECHGEGGWDSWSLFDITIEIPTEFELGRAQILLNKIEMEWIRPRPSGLYGWGRRAERLKLWRFPAATALLADANLEDWTNWNLLQKHKQLNWKPTFIPKTAANKDENPQKIKDTEKVNGHEALLYRGVLKDPRQQLPVWIFDKLLRRTTPKPQLWAWDCPVSNRIWALETETSVFNAHVAREVLDSVQCH